MRSEKLVHAIHERINQSLRNGTIQLLNRALDLNRTDYCVIRATTRAYSVRKILL